MQESTVRTQETQPRFPAFALRAGIDDDDELPGLVKLILGRLAFQSTNVGDAVPLHMGEVQRLCNVTPPTATRLVKLVEASGLVRLERLNGRMIRARWNADHPIVREAFARTSVRRGALPRTAQQAEELPLETGEVELLELLGRAVARERARKLGVQVLLTSLLPPAAEGRAIARWMREHAAALGLEFDALAARVASAYVANDGNNGSLRACGWRLRWLPGELDRISARLARKTPAPPPVEVALAPPPPRVAPEERTARARELGQFAELAKRALVGGAS